jgi:hypothetical protein
MTRTTYNQTGDPYNLAGSNLPIHAHYDDLSLPKTDVSFVRFGIVLPILMLGLLPSLLLLYLGTSLHNHILFLAASGLTLLLIGASSIIIVISGIIGALTVYKYRRLAHYNSHPKPRR